MRESCYVNIFKRIVLLLYYMIRAITIPIIPGFEIGYHPFILFGKHLVAVVLFCSRINSLRVKNKKIMCH